MHKYVFLSRSASILALWAVLTSDLFGLDECFQASGSLEMEEIVRRSGIMKPADNEIRLGFYKDEIRSASGLRGDHGPLRIQGAARTDAADRTRDHSEMMDGEPSAARRNIPAIL